MSSRLRNSKHKHLDIAVACLLISAGVAGFYFLKSPRLHHLVSQDPYEQESSLSRAVSIWVGSLTRQKGNIRFRFGDSAIWHEMDGDLEKVSFGDALFTSKDGEALLHFRSGEKVEVMPNTLVVMKHEKILAPNSARSAASEPKTSLDDTSQSQPPLELKHGRLRITLKKGDLRPVSVQVQGKRYEIAPAPASPLQSKDAISEENTVDIVAVEGHENAPPELESKIALQVQVAPIIEEKEVTPANLAALPGQKSDGQKEALEKLDSTISSPVALSAPSVTKEPEKVRLVTLQPGESFSKKMKKADVRDAAEYKKERVASLSLQKQERKPAELDVEPSAVENTPAPTVAQSALEITKPTLLPVQAIPIAQPKGDGSGTSIELTPSLGMTTLTAKDLSSGTQDSLASSVDAGLDARYIQTWNESFKTFERGRLNYVSFSKPTNSAESVDSASKLLTTIGFGAEEVLSPRLRLSESFDLEQNLFVRADSSTSVTTDSILIPTLGAQVSYDLVRLNAFVLALSFNYSEKMKASTDAYSVGLGSEVGGIIEVRQRKRGEDMFAVDLGTSYRSQDTSLTTQSETAYTLSVRFYFPFSRREDEEQKK